MATGAMGMGRRVRAAALSGLAPLIAGGPMGGGRYYPALHAGRTVLYRAIPATGTARLPVGRAAAGR
ncbi:hypothetical protein [Photorhabdus bodei]|uniref:hypothetical protein n=1 Tax=Photorhabdus bodei TaxID=2029681 RepID=UPI001E321CA4|nr:hypothetical protein [Photorhabdus bodei]MDB6368898.1 hypothetical protein [Photorhabdus bodei]